MSKRPTSDLMVPPVLPDLPKTLHLSHLDLAFLLSCTTIVLASPEPLRQTLPTGPSLDDLIGAELMAELVDASPFKRAYPRYL